MDTSKKYIQMCDEAKEIQNKWNPKIGDYVSTKGVVTARSYYIKNSLIKSGWTFSSFNNIYRVGIISDLHGYNKFRTMLNKKDKTDKLALIAQGTQDGVGLEFLISDLLWLPRQDQLQEIYLDGHTYAVNTYVYQFHKFFNENEKYNLQFNRMEQLWLAFVMKEKYNKIWNGIEWRIE